MRWLRYRWASWAPEVRKVMTLESCLGMWQSMQLSAATIWRCLGAAWQVAQRADMAARSLSTRWMLWQVLQDIAGLDRKHRLCCKRPTWLPWTSASALLPRPEWQAAQRAT